MDGSICSNITAPMPTTLLLIAANAAVFWSYILSNIGLCIRKDYVNSPSALTKNNVVLLGGEMISRLSCSSIPFQTNTNLELMNGVNKELFQARPSTVLKKKNS